MGIVFVGMVLYVRIGLLIHRMGKSSHAGNVEVAYVSDVEICEVIL